MKIEDQSKNSIDKSKKQQQADHSICLGEDIYDLQENQNDETKEIKFRTENQYLQQIQILKEENEKQKKIIFQLRNTIKYYEEKQQPIYQENQFNQILMPKEKDLISEWITQGGREISLQPVYRATSDGFQIKNIYQKCSEINNLIVLIQTEQNKRFGFFTNLEIKDNGYQFITQNPNEIFLFSLDLKQKFTSNKINCEHAFYSNDSYFSVGQNDILIYTNSNESEKSCNNFGCYGEKQGINSGGFLNGGSRNFKTIEIEIFKVDYL
ncbi:TLDc domain protein (macronuclear) [Tetrahymena thermophila SB210]|uniref:TLDc domain protein n=1 Tax=Tetrahymena thermophila (strain SB210) TaxID=312017 RepID=Q236P1_TETTS|nr:TLDc domain protein [Tetrahymena thermophila SB210]EAR92459.1 TLDc domain protein [Tetrahymena thermophila SB210]|eukprot:XP_001012704.1 TLDc domain protein [Tetrahymena thermophila SB210]